MPFWAATKSHRNWARRTRRRGSSNSASVAPAWAAAAMSKWASTSARSADPQPHGGRVVAVQAADGMDDGLVRRGGTGRRRSERRKRLPVEVLGGPLVQQPQHVGALAGPARGRRLGRLAFRWLLFVFCTLQQARAGLVISIRRRNRLAHCTPGPYHDSAAEVCIATAGSVHTGPLRARLSGPGSGGWLGAGSLGIAAQDAMGTSINRGISPKRLWRTASESWSGCSIRSAATPRARARPTKSIRGSTRSSPT